MTNEEVKRMMEQVDEKYIDELTKYDASAQPDEPAEIVSGETPIVKSSPWRAVAAIAAAVLLIVPGVYLAKQASLHMTPSESVSDSMPDSWDSAAETQAVSEETTETEVETLASREYASMEPQDFATLADANHAAFPWQGKVIQWDVIGEKAVDYIHTSGDDLEILYADNDPMSTYIRLHYEQLGEKPADGTHVKPENGKLDADALFGDMEMYIADDILSFYVDYPDYSLFLSMEANQDEFQSLIHALNAVNAESGMPKKETVSEDSVAITYEDAQEFAGSENVPARVMGSEESGTLMTLDESEILHWRVILHDADGSEPETEYLELNYYSSAHHLKLIIGDANYITDQPEIQSWSMKDITKAPAAETVEGSLQNYSFYRKVGELTIAFEGTATMGEIDAFAQFYGNLSYSQETGYVFPVFMSLDEVNKQNTIWNTQVPELEQIGSYTFREADLREFTTVSNQQVKRQNLYYGNDDTRKGLIISYTNMTPEELGYPAMTVGLDGLDAKTLCTDDRYLVDAQNQSRAFVVEMGSYNIIVVAEGGIAQEDMQAVIDAILEANK